MKSILLCILLAFSSINANAQLGDFFRKLGDGIDALTSPKKGASAVNEKENAPREIKKTNNTTSEVSNSNSNETSTQSKVNDIPALQSGTQSPEKVLLSEAISIINTLTADLATKDRLKIYENALNKFDRILEQYGSSDTGLTLKSTGKFGDLDYKRIQQNYTLELTNYYVKTCEVSPSAICQGFVGFKDGTEGCRAAQTFSELRNAHLNLINSMIIFGEQEKNLGLFRLAKTNYLQCNKKTLDVDEFAAKDYFNFQLMKVLLQMREESNARGIIENIKNPFYKFASVIELKKVSGDPIDKAYIARMMKFLDEKFPAIKFSEEIDYLKIASQLSLANIAFSEGSKYVFGDDLGQPESLTQKMIVSLEPRVLSGKDPAIKNNQCKDQVFVREVFELSNEYLQVVDNYRSSRNMTLNSRIMLTSGWIHKEFVKPALGAFGTKRTRGDNWEVPIFNGCPEKYTIALSAISSLYAANKPLEAQKYYTQFTTSNIATDRLKLIDLFLEYAGTKEEYRINSQDGAEKPTIIPYMMTGTDGDFAVFKKHVDNGALCEASALLFNELKESKYSVTARSYINSKNKFSKNKKVKCGDEDLEILLK